MRGVRIAGAVSAAVAVIGSVGTATPAHASNYGVELNGTYRVTLHGPLANVNAQALGADVSFTFTVDALQ